MKRFMFLLPPLLLILLLGGCSIEKGFIQSSDYLLVETGFLYGIVISVLIFYLLVSLLGIASKYPLYFSALLLLTLICSDLYTYNFLMKLLKVSNTRIAEILIYSSKAWILYFFTAYLHELYKSVYSDKILKTVFILSVLQQLYIPLGISTLSTEGPIYYIFYVVYGLELISSFYIIVNEIRSRRKDVFINLFGALVVTASYFQIAFQGYPYFKYVMLAMVYLSLVLQMLSMARKIKKFYEEKTNSELKFLHAQIKPHYIFNALNTIISISRYDAESARGLLCDFSVYLQNSFNLKSEKQFASLKDELEIVNVYLNIEKARFEERIEVEMKLPERTDFPVPVCVLQPIVENAIVHGVLGKPEGGKIFINIEHIDHKLIFSVRDTGFGMSQEKIYQVLESDNIGHIGLSNINKRLKTLYKNGLTINSKPGEGTEVIWEVLLNNQSGVHI